MYKILLLFFISMSAFAERPCADFSGDYTHYRWGQWITKAHIVQNGCETLEAEYRIPSGMRWSRTLYLNDTEYVTGQDGQGLVHFETCHISSSEITLKGRTEDNGQIKSTWKGAWSFGSKGELMDYVESFDATGKSDGPVTIKFLRD